jgi:pyruvate,water dikinase
MISLASLRYLAYQVFAPTKHLRRNYNAFRDLLEHDHRSHEWLAALEKYFHESKRVDFHAVIKAYERLSHSVSKMIECLDLMAPGFYGQLFSTFREIDSTIQGSGLKIEAMDASLPFVLPLDQFPPQAERLVGGKAGRLSKIAVDLGLPIPRGFVVTSKAYAYFIEFNQLSTRIEAALADLDLDSPLSLEKTSTLLTSLILEAFLPPGLEKAMGETFADLMIDDRSSGVTSRWAVRSSAVGEDGVFSFAGQFKTVLNIDPKNLGQAYKEVLASKYSPNALFYRVKNGFLDQETPMAVLILEMIDAVASGIVYSQSPVSSGSTATTVYSVWGLGEHLVKGDTAPDVIEVSREEERAPQVIRKDQGARDTKMVISKDARVRTVPLETQEKQRLSLDDGSASQLAAWAGQLELHFGTPQDVEWCQDHKGRLYILQSRPLRLEGPAPVSCDFDPSQIPNPVLLSAGEKAASGVGTGKVVVAHSAADLKDIPKDSVLVAHTTAPRWAQAMDRLNAVVTDLGSVAGHFASVAREWRVPTLVNTGVATQRLKPGEIVTVDADRALVFAGTIQGLSNSLCEKQELSPESPFMKRLRLILDHASPLNLLNPQDPGFVPENCRTLHDMVRFIHEKAVQEMFSLGGKNMRRVRGAKKLISEIPITLYVLDLGEGARDAPGSKREVYLKDVENLGLQALWKGLSHRDILWSEDVLHFDWEEFDRLSAGLISVDSQLLASFAVVSKDYLNINVRFGYHFVVIDALFGTSPSDNYLSLRFKGGGASADRRNLRVQFLARVLLQSGFESDFEGDTIDARHRGSTQSEMERKLEMLGFLLGFTRLMDQKLEDMRSVELFAEEFLRKFPPN